MLCWCAAAAGDRSGISDVDAHAADDRMGDFADGTSHDCSNLRALDDDWFVLSCVVDASGCVLPRCAPLSRHLFLSVRCSCAG